MGLVQDGVDSNGAACIRRVATRMKETHDGALWG